VSESSTREAIARGARRAAQAPGTVVEVLTPDDGRALAEVAARKQREADRARAQAVEAFAAAGVDPDAVAS
jgi:hypothetical protein